MAITSPSPATASLEAQRVLEPIPTPPPQNASPLPHLPPEIIDNIIRLSLPSLRADNFDERYDTLLVLTRVNSIWHALAQSHLQRHLHFQSRSDLTRFIRGCKDKDLEGTWLRGIRSLRWTDHDVWTFEDVNSLFAVAVQHLNNLEEIWVSTFKDEDTESGGDEDATPAFRGDLRVLAERAPNLRSLVVDYFEMAPRLPSASPMLLPKLETLGLSDLLNPSPIFEAMGEGAFPALRNLFLSYLIVECSAVSFDSGFAPVGPQLHTLGVADRQAIDGIIRNAHTLKNLHNITFDGDADLFAQLLHKLPSSLRTFRLRRYHNVLDNIFKTVLDLFLPQPQSLVNLRFASLPSFTSVTPHERECLSEIRRITEEKGVRLEEVQFEFDMYRDRWEEMVMGW